MVIGDLPQMLAAKRRKDVVSSIAEDAAFSSRNYRELLDLAASGRLRAVIDRSFALEDIAQAHRLVDSGHKRGSVIITVAPSQQ
jgi:NADPH:quinone reductase-like Zn-dependent oxidoreductase